MNKNNIKYRLIDVFYEEAKFNVNVLHFFTNDTTEEEVAGKFTVSTHPHFEIIDQFEGMLLCKIEFNGKTFDDSISCSSVVTGVYFVENLNSIIKNKEDKAFLFNNVQKEVYPYVRELLLDMSKRFPISNMIKIPPTLQIKNKTIEESNS